MQFLPKDQRYTMSLDRAYNLQFSHNDVFGFQEREVNYLQQTKGGSNQQVYVGPPPVEQIINEDIMRNP